MSRESIVELSEVQVIRDRIRSRSDSVGKISDLENNKDTNENEERRVSAYKKRRNFIKDYIIDYTTNSNLHGLKYIGERERTYVEKIFWLFMFICCVVLCSGLIRKVWIKWNESPVIVSFAETSTPVWQIPYPAVTLCFETKSSQTKFNFTEYFHLYNNNETFANLTDSERHMFEDISMVCDDHLAPKTGRQYSSGIDIVETIKYVSPNLTDVFFGCKWKDVGKQNCSDLFSPILTEEGLCYTFNTLGADELFRVENLHDEYPYLEHENRAEAWSLEEGYAPSTPLETYPHRGSGYGVKSGLTFLMNAVKEDLDYLCRGPVQGFKILLHNPAELPRLSQQYFRAPLMQEVVVAVKPKMMTTSSGLKPYDPTRRQCYFPSERYLRYFKVYTQANCEMECLSNFTYTRCGCVHFGMPRGPNMTVCNAGSMTCIKNSQKTPKLRSQILVLEGAIQQSEFEGKGPSIRSPRVPTHTKPPLQSVEFQLPRVPLTISTGVQKGRLYNVELVTIEIQSGLDLQGNSTDESLGQAREVSSQCKCLPSCTSIEYEAETSQADFDWRDIFRSYAQDIPDFLENATFTRVLVFFKEAQFITSRRSELYGQTDFLANCGGLLGLFMGFSILSVAEILYFLTLRLYCVYLRKRNHKRKLAASLKIPPALTKDKKDYTE